MGCSFSLFIFLKGSIMSITVSSSLASYFSSAALPHMDRRGTAERRVPVNPKPLAEPQPSWGRHAMVAGFLGVVLGSAGAMAVLAQRAASIQDQPANLVVAQQPASAVTVTAPLFDATPAASGVHTVAANPAVARTTGAATGAATVEAAASAESYSEDAASVPGASYREPPVIPPGASRPHSTSAR